MNFIWGIMGFDSFAIRHKKVMNLGGFSCQDCIFINIWILWEYLTYHSFCFLFFWEYFEFVYSTFYAILCVSVSEFNILFKLQWHLGKCVCASHSKWFFFLIHVWWEVLRVFARANCYKLWCSYDSEHVMSTHQCFLYL